ncbi:hypothetical protein Tco_0925003 [Tanacetum coccineum]|uniref:Uncharacterized protein n=1 Tax=Tanacetum coccineum TaxID=301880 RepID=A0ABQ5DCL0_9ASTR
MAYIDSLSAEDDINLPIMYSWDMQFGNRRIFRATTLVLKSGAKKGLIPFNIRRLMSRYNQPDMKSMIGDVFDAVHDALPLAPTDKEFIEEVIKDVNCIDLALASRISTFLGEQPVITVWGLSVKRTSCQAFIWSVVHDRLIDCRVEH